MYNFLYEGRGAVHSAGEPEGNGGMDYIEKLRTKSNETKARYAFFGAIVLTCVIAGVWSSTLPARFAAMETKQNKGDENAEQPAFLKEFFATTKEQMGAVLEGVTDVDEGDVGTSGGDENDIDTRPEEKPTVTGSLERLGEVVGTGTATTTVRATTTTTAERADAVSAELLIPVPKGMATTTPVATTSRNTNQGVSTIRTILIGTTSKNAP